MKKLMAFLLALCLILVLSGCAQPEAPQDNNDQNQTIDVTEADSDLTDLSSDLNELDDLIGSSELEDMDLNIDDNFFD